MSGEFLSNYISECLGNGIVSTEGICNNAESEILKIDIELKQFDILKEKQAKLRSIVKQLGGIKYKDYDTKSIVSDFSIPESKLDSKFKEFCVKICNFMDAKNSGIMPREIMDGVASIEDNPYVYSAIKWLAERNIIMREADTRLIIKGKDWENRPINV